MQQEVFRRQIRLARSRRLPIVIHTREADEDTFRILREEQADDIGGVFHCFTGDRAMAQRALDIGFHLSLAGIVTFPRAFELKEVAKIVPLDRLLIETDSPYLGKGWPIWRPPALPIRIRVRLGERFVAEADDAALLQRLERYFARELRGAPLAAPEALAATEGIV